MKTFLLIVFLITALVFAFLYFKLKSKIVEVSDTVSEKKRGNTVMKLQNELKPFIEIKDDKICIKVVKK